MRQERNKNSLSIQGRRVKEGTENEKEEKKTKKKKWDPLPLATDRERREREKSAGTAVSSESHTFFISFSHSCMNFMFKSRPEAGQKQAIWSGRTGRRYIIAEFPLLSLSDRRTLGTVSCIKS